MSSSGSSDLWFRLRLSDGLEWRLERGESSKESISGDAAELVMTGNRNCSFLILLIIPANAFMLTAALNLWYFHSSEKRLQYVHVGEKTAPMAYVDSQLTHRPYAVYWAYSLLHGIWVAFPNKNKALHSSLDHVLHLQSCSIRLSVLEWADDAHQGVSNVNLPWSCIGECFV